MSNKKVKANKTNVTKMGGEEFLSDMPKKGAGKKTKVTSKNIDGEKFLSTKEKKIKSFESFVNENYKDELEKLDNQLENLLDTEPSNKEEEKEYKETLKDIENQINQIKFDKAEKEKE